MPKRPLAKGRPVRYAIAMPVETVKTKVCGACGFENRPQAKFCGECGRELMIAAGGPPPPEEIPPPAFLALLKKAGEFAAARAGLFTGIGAVAGLVLATFLAIRSSRRNRTPPLAGTAKAPIAQAPPAAERSRAAAETAPAAKPKNTPATARLDGARQWLQKIAGSEPAPRVMTAVGFKRMAEIPAGEFQMGSSRSPFKDEAPEHKVYLDTFRLDKKEVTVRQYEEFERARGPWKRAQPNWSSLGHPVVNVSWKDADAYCRWAGKRLPTEAEWEKAARGGGKRRQKWSFGNKESKTSSFAWYLVNSDKRAHPAGEKRANGYGLFDMHGNVWEWVADRYDAGYYAKSPARSPTGPALGDSRVYRGGSWKTVANTCRSAVRGYARPDKRSIQRGFRCAFSVKKGPR